MKKNEIGKLLNRIKAHYPNQFILEDYVIEVWSETLEPYSYDDAIARLHDYLNENPLKSPQPHTFIKGMLTEKEKEDMDDDYLVNCNLCGKEVLYSMYDEHFRKCLLCKALETKAKENNKNISYEEFMRIPYEKLNATYGKLFERKISNNEILDRIRG